MSYLDGGLGEYNKKTNKEKYIDVHDFYDGNYACVYGGSINCYSFLLFK